MRYYNFHNRDKRQRSIKEIHDLYIRTKNRSLSRRHILSDIIDEIVERIPLTGPHERNQKHITYYQNDDTFYQYEMSYHNDWQCYGTCTNMVKFEGTVEEIRTQTIDFIILNDLAFELGEKYRKFYDYDKYLHRRVMHYMDEAIKKHLVEIYKNVKFQEVPKVIPVNIDEYQYIYHLDTQSSSYYKKFNLVGEVEIGPVVI